MRIFVHALLLVAGYAAIVYGVYQLSEPAAWIVGGSLALIAGIPARRSPRGGE